MRFTRAHNRVVLLTILACCSVAMYCLTLKIKRIMAVNEMDRNSQTVTTIMSTLYIPHNLSWTGSPTLSFIVHAKDSRLPSDLFCETKNATKVLTSEIRTTVVGPTKLLIGTCDTVEKPGYFALNNDEFAVSIDPRDLASSSDATVCIAYAYLFEDFSTLRSIIQYYKVKSKRIVIYVGSWNEQVWKEANKYSRILEVIPWQMMSNKPLTDSDTIPLDADSLQTTVSGALTDCWLRNGPKTKSLTMIDLADIEFASRKSNETEDRLLKSLHKHKTSNWTLEKLEMVKITDNKKLVLNITERCYTRKENAEEGCLHFGSNEDTKTFVRKTTSLKKMSSSYFGQSSYRQDVEKCSSYIGPSEETRRMLKLEFDIGRTAFDDPCSFPVYRASYRCRAATQYTKRMFDGKLKINVVQKREMLRFSDGCHF